MSPLTPEQKARQEIDAALAAAGWKVQDEEDMNLSAGSGVAVREFPMASGYGFADYLLFVDGRPVGALEAKKKGYTLTGVEGQTKKYSEGLPTYLQAPVEPLPFLYESTGVETRFTNRLDPHPRSRRVFSPHRPETMDEWLSAPPLGEWIEPWRQTVDDEVAEQHPAYDAPPSSLRCRLRALPAGEVSGLWPNQQRAVANLEASLAEDRPRSLIQMATGSGKSRMAVAAIYRLIKFGDARRVLFLVDRSNLGKQAEDEFATYRTYDDHRKFTDLYQRPAPDRQQDRLVGEGGDHHHPAPLLDAASGEPEFEPEFEESSRLRARGPG